MLARKRHHLGGLNVPALRGLTQIGLAHRLGLQRSQIEVDEHLGENALDLAPMRHNARAASSSLSPGASPPISLPSTKASGADHPLSLPRNLLSLPQLRGAGLAPAFA